MAAENMFSLDCYRTAFDLIGHGVYELDPTGCIVFVGDHFAESLGYTRGELEGQSYKLLESQTDSVIGEESSTETDKEKALPITFLNKSGSKMPAIVREIPFTNSLEEGCGLLRVVQWISATDSVGETLRDDSLFLSVIDTLPIFVIEKDENGKVTFVNDRAAAEFGDTPENLNGKTDFDLFPDTLARNYREDDQDVIRTGEIVEYIEWHATKSLGSANAFPVQVLKIPLGTEEGALSRVRVLYWRLEDRSKILVELLRAKEHFFRSVVENVPLSIFRKDRNRRFTYVSGRWCKNAGLEASDVLGKTDHELGVFQASEADKYAGDDERVLAGARVDEEEDHTVMGDRQIVRVKKTPLLGNDGEIIGLQGVFWDVTEQVQTTRKLVASQRETHHRVKNNLQTVSSLVKMQLRRLDKSNIAARKELLICIERLRTMALIHEVFYLHSDLTEIFLGSFIEPVIKLICKLNNISPSQIEFEIGQIDDVAVIIDRAIPCARVVSELVSNSIKHAFPNGRKGRVVVSITLEPASMICVEVADNGIGLPNDLDFRLVSSMGLQLVHELVEDELAGSIDLDRQNGTRFTIRIPLAENG